MQQQGKFLLFSGAEFSNWLAGLTVVRKIKLIQNHHTWLPDYKTFSAKPNNHFALLQSMERSHRERGFEDRTKSNHVSGRYCSNLSFV